MKNSLSKLRRDVVRQLEELSKKRKYVRGGEIIHFLKKTGFSEPEAEQLVKILIAEGCLCRVGRTINLWDDLFRLNEKKLRNIALSGISFPNENENISIQMEELLLSGSQKTEAITLEKMILKNIVCVISIPPIIKVDFKKYNCITLKEAFKFLINSAKSQLKIMSPFLDRFGVTQYLYDLINAANRGVKIKILVRRQGGDEGKGLQHLCDTFKINGIKNSLEIRSFYIERGRTQMYTIHGKMIITDDSKAYIGSGEFRANSLWGLIEVGIITSNNGIVTPLVELFKKIWNESNLIWKV